MSLNRGRKQQAAPERKQEIKPEIEQKSKSSSKPAEKSRSWRIKTKINIDYLQSLNWCRNHEAKSR